MKKITLEDKKIKAIKNINLPKDSNKIVLYDPDSKSELQELLADVQSDIKQYRDFSMLDDDMNRIDEAIIISVVRKTNKDWYNNQRLLLNGYNIPVKVIQY